MRPRQNFTLYPRKRNGKTYWYYRCYNSFGVRTSGISTGETSKVKARLKCEELFKNGLLKSSSNIKFKIYADNFFSPGSAWYKRNNKYKSVSENYILSSSRILNAVLMPYFSEMKLNDITPDVVDEFQYMCFKKYRPSTVSTYMGYLKIILNQAELDGLITKSPIKNIKLVSKTGAYKDKLTLDELVQIVQYPKTLEKIRVFTVIAACTGMRMGEVAGIGPDVMKDNYIDCKRQYTLEKYTPTKTKTPRCVPMCEELKNYIQWLMDNGFNFAIKTTTFSAVFCKLINRLGLNKNKRVSFHSTRHFFNTYLLSNNINPVKVGAILGHATGITDVQAVYTNFDINDYSEVLEIQKKIFATLNPPFTR